MTTRQQHYRISPRTMTTTRRQRPPSHCVFYLHPHVIDALDVCCEYTFTCWRIIRSILAAPGCLDEANLLRCSLVILLCHHVDSRNEAYVPPSIWIWLALASFSSFFCILLTQQDAAMATALVTLFILEAVLPVLFVLFTTFLIWKQVSWTTGLFIMAILWTILVSLANWIRRTVYQSMGHGWLLHCDLDRPCSLLQTQDQALALRI